MIFFAFHQSLSNSYIWAHNTTKSQNLIGYSKQTIFKFTNLLLTTWGRFLENFAQRLCPEPNFLTAFSGEEVEWQKHAFSNNLN